MVKTKWAVFPPQDPDPETGLQAGIPVALLGWVYFSGVVIWYALIGQVSYKQRFWYFLLLLVMFVSCVISLLFIYILYTQMEFKCLWCIRAHIINFAILFCTLLLWPRKPKPDHDVRDEEIADSGVVDETRPLPIIETCHPEPYPGVRIIVATFACVAAVAFAEFQINLRFLANQQIQQATASYKACKQQFEAVQENTEMLLSMFEQAESVKVKLRKDDPRRGEKKWPARMVVFSDFQCPACRSFADELEKDIQPGFDNLLQIVWKHYPICTDCNPSATYNLHPNACQGAYAAEAARLQGGNDGFWKAHDYMFKNPKLMHKKEIDWRQVAVDLEFDPEKFLADMKSAKVISRVAEDIKQAQELKVNRTPTIYLGGKPIRRFMLANDFFVEKLSKYFKLKRKRIMIQNKQRNKHKHVEKNQTKNVSLPSPIPSPASIPDSQDPPDAQ